MTVAMLVSCEKEPTLETEPTPVDPSASRLPSEQ